MKFKTHAELAAATRSLLNDVQKEKFDQLMATGTWKVNKALTLDGKTVCWLRDHLGRSVIGLNLRGGIERPVKGKSSVLFSRTTLERVY
ncbi:hypothetical protein EVB91_173 [Rhizobium phage RHph_I1_18]|nr:hypothetical protein EVB91_173 [Rhizobium phage RHph_I1_18]